MRGGVTDDYLPTSLNLFRYSPLSRVPVRGNSVQNSSFTILLALRVLSIIHPVCFTSCPSIRGVLSKTGYTFTPCVDILLPLAYPPDKRDRRCLCLLRKTLVIPMLSLHRLIGLYLLLPSDAVYFIVVLVSPDTLQMLPLRLRFYGNGRSIRDNEFGG